MTQAINSEFPGLIDHEQQVWRALCTGDAKTDRALLLGGFIGVYPSGFAGAADHAGQLDNGPSIRDFELSEFKAFAVGPDHAMLCYHAAFRRAGAELREAMYVSSLWQRVPQGWRNLFSQDTPVDNQPPK